MPVWDKVSFVLASQARFLILATLNHSPAVPTDLARNLSLPKPRVSLALHELAAERMVECLTPERRKARLYGITAAGRETLHELEKITSGRGKIFRPRRNRQKGPLP